jgi:uncharacterized SAM-binding protein YcdF (DUF218 family)
MIQKNETNNTNESRPARKKVYILPLAVLFTVIIIVIPLFSIKKYAEILQSQAPNPILTQSLSKDRCGVVLTGAAGRVREAISLLSHNHVQKLIISGVHQHSTLNDMFPEILFYPEIKLENVILERRSNSTATNAQSSLPIVEALHCQSVLLITSDYHMYRALKTFKQVFPGTLQITPYIITSDRMHFRQNVFVDTRFWGTVIEEWAKYLFYEAFVFSSQGS